MAAYLVNKTLDGDNNIIKSTSDVYARGKAKALLIKINKGTAERPAMPEVGAAPASNQAVDQNKSTAKPAALSNEDIIATVVNQALDGDEGPLNELTDKVLRAKSKSLIMKINKGTAERPAMPEVGAAPANNGDDSLETQLDNSTKEIINEESEGDLIERLVSEGIKGNMEEINSLENKVLRGKIKAAIVKAKRS